MNDVRTNFEESSSVDTKRSREHTRAHGQHDTTTGYRRQVGKFLLRIPEAPVSDVSPENSHRDWSVLWFSSASSCRCQNSAPD
jgi:hypothetical protein